jgi:UMF1 family MFS transporter
MTTAIQNRRAIYSWALYDFANSPFTTLVVTFVYATYFSEFIAANSVQGQTLWGYAITTTALIVAISSPFLGAIADQGGYRKRFVVIATLITAAATAALYGVVPGQIVLALILFVIANVAFELAIVFYNAYLPDLTRPSDIGRISGWGWGLGYIGGLLALIVALVTLVQPQALIGYVAETGLSIPDEPWFGFSIENGENVRATNLLVAIWLLVFSLPLFLFVHERKSIRSSTAAVVSGSFQQLTATFREIRKHKEMVKFLLARLVYNDGLVTIFAFGGIYASGTFGFSLTDVLVFGIVINFAAGIGAIAMGYVDDWIGAKRTIVISLLGLILAGCIGVFAREAVWFWFAGILIGIFSGPNQAASRSLMGRYIPKGLENEFFGFFAFSGKLTAFIGPLLLAFVTDVAQSQRAGLVVVIVLFVLGLIMLGPVREPEAGRPLE